jgi:hypothetical protein
MRWTPYMTMSVVAAAAVLTPAVHATSCAPQPLPPEIDSAGPLMFANPAGSTIEFAAAPSLEYPGRGWVVRLYRRGAGNTSTLEVLLLRRQHDCNRYDIESRWDKALPAADYQRVAAAVAPFMTPNVDTFITGQWSRSDEMVLDGTSISLRLRDSKWEIERRLNHYEPGGRGISAIFEALVRLAVPADQLPTSDWRSKRPAQ